MLRKILICVAVLIVLVMAGDVLAQTDAAGAATEAATDRSFAAAFFIARRQDGSVEILGSLVIWFLLLLSIGSIGLIGHMALTNQRKSIIPQGVVDQVKVQMEKGKFRDVLALTEEEGSFFSRVLNAALHEAGHGFSAVIRALEETSDELTVRRLRKIEYLNVLGQVSPMIGLFGTVYGMILAFQAIVVASGNADPVALAGGIGTALTTTFWGLVVAIPALASYAIIRNKIDELTTEATLTAEEMCNQFRPKGSGSSRSSSSSSSGSSSGGSSESRSSSATPQPKPRPE